MAPEIEPKEVTDFYDKDNFVRMQFGDPNQILVQGLPTTRESRRWKERQKRGKRERVKVESKGFG